MTVNISPAPPPASLPRSRVRGNFEREEKW